MYFPLVGIIVGFVCALVYLIATITFSSPPLAALFALTAGVLLTGGLHEDGLADFADGLGGGRDRKHRLEIMKDSRIGSYGTIALILVFSINFVALDRLKGPSFLVMASLIAAHGVSRALLPIIAALTPYARETDDSKTAPLADPLPSHRLFGLSFFATFAVMPIPAAYMIEPQAVDPLPFFNNGPLLIVLTMAAAILAAPMIAVVMTRISQRKLGGWTGDTLGATQVVCFTTFLIFIAPQLWI